MKGPATTASSTEALDWAPSQPLLSTAVTTNRCRHTPHTRARARLPRHTQTLLPAMSVTLCPSKHTVMYTSSAAFTRRRRYVLPGCTVTWVCVQPAGARDAGAGAGRKELSHMALLPCVLSHHSHTLSQSAFMFLACRPYWTKQRQPWIPSPAVRQHGLQ